jgi:hypothetical protein
MAIFLFPSRSGFLPPVLLRLAVAALLVVLPRGASGDEPPRLLIDAARLRAHVEFLARDELAGRDSGEPGLEVAAEYLALRLRETGLAPAGDGGTYFQRFTVPFGSDFGRVLGAVLSDGQGREEKLDPGTDVVAFAHGEPGAGIVDAPVAFAGYGVRAGEEERKAGLAYDDFAGLDVKGKVLIILRFVPRFGRGDDPFGGRRSPHAALLAKLRHARELGAAGVILVTPPAEPTAPPGGGTPPEPGAIPDADGDLQGIAHRASPRHPMLPALVARREAVDRILRESGKDLAGLARAIDETLKPQSFDIAAVRLRFDTTPGHRLLRNVAGKLEGSGSLAGEAVVIGAHYDHIGRFGNQVDPKNLGRIHNGADDNASGTAGVLELARVLAAGPREESRRAIIFLLFSGEEIGLLGSRAWLQAVGTEGAGRIAAMVNLDMIGRARDGAPVSVIGAGSAAELGPLLDGPAERNGLKLAKSDGAMSGGSDHASFLGRGIPTLFFFTGMHPQYNTPDDDPPTINYEGERRLLELVREVLEGIARLPAKPAFLQSAVASAGHGRPKLGVEMDPDAEEPGVRVTGVLDGSPAEKAGVLKGDVIVGLGGARVTSSRDLLLAVQDSPEGEEVPLEVVRDGGKATLKVLFPQRARSFRVVFGSVPDYAFAERGVRFESIRDGTPAKKAGVQAGDVLVRWNDKEVENVEQWTELLGGQKPGDEVTITVKRAGKEELLKVKLEGRD